MFFKKSKEDNIAISETSDNQTQPDSEEKSLYERPRVCVIDLLDEHIDILKSHKYDCFIGTLGSIVEVPNTRKDTAHLCLPNLIVPENLHEYDIVIIDLQNKRTVQYDPKKS